MSKPQWSNDTPEEKNARLGSAILCGLIRDLINRMTPEEVADMLGASTPSQIPGTERVCKTSQVARLAA